MHFPMPTPSDDTPSISEITWTWSSPNYGWLSTTILPDGSVTQGRQYSPSSEPLFEQSGTLTADEAGRIGDAALTALASANAPAASANAPATAPAATPDNPPPAEEGFDLRVVGAGGTRTAHVALAGLSGLSGQPAFAKFRQTIIRARHRAGGGYISWSNVGARLAIVVIVLLGFFTYLSISGSRDLARMQREAQRTDATVIVRHGQTGYDKYKYLIVRLTPAGASAPIDVKITDSLSAHNWAIANPGSHLRVWYLPGTGKTCTEDDIQRNIQDQNGSSLPLFPICFGIPGLALTWFMSRYRAECYPDGKEFMIRGDRVVLDGKAMPFSDGDLLAARAFISIAS
jgi:hypothetical protein